MTQIIQTNLDELLADCGTIDAVSWQAPKQMTYAQWAEIGEKFQYVSGSMNWWLGDWLAEGEKRYGETYTQAVELTGHKQDHLMKCKQIAEAVQKRTRVQFLSWTHHRYVSHLPDNEQRLWLEHAQEHSLSSRELKQALEQANAHRKPLPNPELDWMPEEPKILPIPEIYTNGNGTNGFHSQETTNDEPPYMDDSLYADDNDDEQSEYREKHFTVIDEHGIEEHVTVKPDEELTVVNKPHVAQNSGNNEWYTPSEYIDAARRVLGSIDLDPASNPLANEVVKASNYYTAQDDGLSHEWHGSVWMNPPYAGDLIGKFIEKLYKHYVNEEVIEAIVLVNNATETAWFQRLTEVTSAICFPRRRVRFWSPTKDEAAPLQGQAVLYLGENKEKFIEAFSSFGLVVSVINAG